MATLEQLENALRNADASGASEDAAILAKEISRMRGQSSFDQKAAQFLKPTNQAPAFEAHAARNPIGSKASVFLGDLPFVGEFADESLSKLGSFVGQNDEATSLEAMRTMREREHRINPIQSMALGGAGGLVGTATAAAAAAPALPGLLAAAPKSMAVKTGLATILGMLGGGAEGTISGFGAGEGPLEFSNPDRQQSALERGKIGTLLGGGFAFGGPLVAKGIEKASDPVIKGLKEFLSNTDSGVRRAVAGSADDIGISTPARNSLTRALEADALVPGGALAAPDSMLADAGRNSRQLLDVSIQNSGPAGTVASHNVEKRAAGAKKLMDKALDDALGTPDGVFAIKKGLREGTKKARKATYDAAYAVPINYSKPLAQEIEGLLERVPEEAIKNANKLMKVQGVKSAQILARVGDDGAVVFESLPDVRQLDFITRGLNQLAESSEGTGAFGKQTAMGASLENLSGDIRRRLKVLVPEYKAALDTAADPLSKSRAVEFGNDLFLPKNTDDVVADKIEKMSKAEINHVKQGIRSKIDNIMAETKRAASDGNMDAREAVAGARQLSSRANRTKLRRILGDTEGAALFDKIDQATDALELRAAVANNSLTHARRVGKKSVTDQVQPGVIKQTLSGHPVEGPRQMLEKAFGTTPADLLAQEDKIFSEVAEALTGPNAEQLRTQLLQLAKTNEKAAEFAQRLGIIGATGLAVSGHQAGTRLEGLQDWPFLGIKPERD
jgi:hypothetical protein